MIEDQRQHWNVRSRTVLGKGRVSNFVEDVVELPSGGTMTRQFVTHPGAVAIVPWDEQLDEIVVLRQYRHPVGMELVEIPAGLLDVPGEPWHDAAVRELAEEAQLQARRWDVLIDLVTTPGGCEESLRIYLARDLKPAPRPDGFVLEGEEREMTLERVARQALLEAVFAGRCQSPTLVSGMLALEVARLSGKLDALRGVDADWPIRE